MNMAPRYVQTMHPKIAAKREHDRLVGKQKNKTKLNVVLSPKCFLG